MFSFPKERTGSCTIKTQVFFFGGINNLLFNDWVLGWRLLLMHLFPLLSFIIIDIVVVVAFVVVAFVVVAN